MHSASSEFQHIRTFPQHFDHHRATTRIASAHCAAASGRAYRCVLRAGRVGCVTGTRMTTITIYHTLSPPGTRGVSTA
eukprot:COSAG02_NODE_8823_length_2431_cov_2.855060_5_plen_78_part_00